jgi:hypothetical protein
LSRGLLAVLILVLILAVIVPLGIALALGPKARDKVVELLEKRFDRVQLESLEVRFAPGFTLLPRIAATGSGLSVSLPDRADAPPFITMNEFEVEVGLLGLLADPIRVKSLELDELRIQIPPKQPKESDSGSSKGEPPPVFVIDELVADGAVLRILPRDQGKEPLQFDLHQLRVLSAGVAEPMEFDAMLDNPKPPGRIETRGRFGPLLLRAPGDSPVSGEYVFKDADLSAFKGIAGILHSRGRFDGVLERIGVSGTTETSDFQLASAGNPLPLNTVFEAIVDGTNGNTFLTPVEATLGTSRILTKGGVARLPGDKGKTVCVDAESEEGRIEDFLRLTMKSEQPVMTGGIRFKSMILIPPGDVDVTEKLVLDGAFAIDSAAFPERKVQEKVEKLSEVGTGKGGDAGAAVDSLRQERVLSDIRGDFALSKAVMTLSSLSFTVPGASVTLEGTYGLKSQEMDFHGELRLDSKLSETTTGIKSFLLKLVDPLFGDDQAGAVIPIRITGTADKPSFGVEMGRLLTREKVTAPPATHGALSEPIRSCVEVLGAEWPQETPGTD